MDSSFGLFFIIVILAAIGGSYLIFYYFSKAARTRRALRSTERTLVADAIEGTLVKIAGRVKFVGESMEAPLSGRPCAVWEVVIEENRSSGQSSHWKTIISDYEAQHFVVEDESGKALVKPVVPQLALEQDARYRSGTFNDAPPELERFLSSRGHSSTGILGFNKSMRYREGVVEEGEQVAVYGVCRWEHDPAPTTGGAGYRDAPRRLVIESPSESPLLISDAPSVGD